MDSLKLNLEVMDNFIRFINTGDIDLGQSIISPDVVFYASTLFSMLIQLVFGGQAVGANGGEFSFQVFAPGQETGFLHTHKNHEELYFFLRGRGEFQVDGEVFPVEEGSVVRVSPDGRRCVRNNGTEPLVMLCVQYRGNTFTAEDAADGNILNEPIEW